MCGIVGVANDDGRPVSAERIERMATAVEHRGPDSEGQYLSAGVGIGIRRLRIIDLVTGDQPITNEDRSVWAVLNGEIYNFQSLRTDLAAKGHRFVTQGDTEAIVHGYEEYGEGVLARLRGMFAIALWDDRHGRLLLARDRLGKKPLLYARVGGELRFGSEMRAVLAAGDLARDIDLGALGDYLAYGYVPTPATIYRAVRKVRPGHVLTWGAGRFETRPYWTLRYEPKLEIDEATALEELDRRLSEATRLRLISDVPLGALLSGGVDSSVVVALMARHDSTVRTFSIGFEDSAYDELAHARRVAERFRTEHHEQVVRADAASILPTLVRRFGEPFADSSAIPTYYVAKLAREHVTVALNGDGGDESFAGYDRYRGIGVARTLARIPGFPAFARTVRAAARLPGVPAKVAGRIDRFTAAARLSERDRYVAWMSPLRADLARGLLVPDVAAAVDRERSRAVERTYDALAALGPIDRLVATDVATYLLDDLMVKMDISSMANSLETRSPLLDHEVVEFAARLPERLKLSPGGEQKYLLRMLARRLVPAENVDRPKQGFGVPIGRWLRGELREMAADALLTERSLSRGYLEASAVRRLWDEHQRGIADRAAALWTLLMLELWQREFEAAPRSAA